MFIIPMAGKSSRFYNAGYKVPKYMLPLGNFYVFDEAVKSFKLYFKNDLFVFIVHNEEMTINFVKERCKSLGICNFEIIIINSDTRGQADTVNLGLLNSSKNLTKEELYIFNIDSIRINFKKPSNLFLKDISGYLEVFEGEGEHWSFIDAIDYELVGKTTEKERISNLCSNGLYYFSSLNEFQSCFKIMEANNCYSELFVAPMYNFIINNRKIVKYIKIDPQETLFSGIPEEYEILKTYYEKK